MEKVVLIPTLSCCVESAARAEYEAGLRQLLAGEGDCQRLSERVETLTVFLKTTDFRRLRAQYEELLAAGLTIKFQVYMEDGILKYEMELNGDTDELASPRGALHTHPHV
jgi:hypothetical protein